VDTRYIERIIDKVVFENQCWIWKGGKTFRLNGDFKTPRRASYILFVGDIGGSVSLTMDCKNPDCINPLHIRCLDEVQRFRSKVYIQPDGCHFWLGKLNKEGYGNFKVDGKTLLAHSFSYQLAYGESVPRSYQINHTCNNKWCVNPEHLNVGTQRDNISDRIENEGGKLKAGPKIGSRHPKSKHSEYFVHKVKKDVLEYSQKGKINKQNTIIQVAKQHEVNSKTLSGWIYKSSFKHVFVDFRECELHQEWKYCMCNICFRGPGFREIIPDRLKFGDFVTYNDEPYMFIGNNQEKPVFTNSSGKKIALKSFQQHTQNASLELFNQFSDEYSRRTGACIPKWEDIPIYTKILKAPRLTPKQRRELLERYGSKCNYCQVPLTMDTMTVDRIIQGKDGGEYNIENCLPSCKPCNSGRRD
jgi:hypothetical protein